MNNEDCLNIVEIADKRTLFVVCDGMGGHSCGEVASKTICKAFSEYWEQHSDQSDSEQKVLDAAKIASKALDEKSGYSDGDNHCHVQRRREEGNYSPCW